MKIGLINWSGNKNLGDDAMAMIIGEKVKELGHEPINMGESPQGDVDAYIWGGGTLIDSSTGVFPKLPKDKPVVGFGLGVSETPIPNHDTPVKMAIGPHEVELNLNLLEDIIRPSLMQKNVRHLYMRDPFSYEQMGKWGFDFCTLSHDPCLWFKLKNKKPRKYLAVNFIEKLTTGNGKFETKGIHLYKGSEGYALSDKHDLKALKKHGIKGKYYKDPEELIDLLAGAHSAIATKLHAAVFCKVAEVPKIKILPYAPKVKRFYEYCDDLDKARKDLDKHIKEAVWHLSR